MDPVGSWSAYAASYNRLTNAGGIPNGASSDLLGSSNCGQSVSSSTSQLLLQAHAGPAMPTASPFTTTGFLSPPPVPYDGVFTPIFHQKAHYGTFQHRPSLKQASDQECNQLAPVGGNFLDQSTGWSQSTPQLPSPFGILPHESVVPNSSAKPYDTINPHATFSGLNHNSQFNTAFADPKKQPQFSTTSKSAFFQQSIITESGYKHCDYPPRFSYSHIQQPCAVQAAASGPREYRFSPPSRIFFDQNIDRNDYVNSLSKINNSGVKAKDYDSSERGGLDCESQSSPISYAMMDAQRGFQSPKARPHQYHVGDEQSCRFSTDYSRKANDSYCASSTDYVGTTRRSPSGHSASPIYPMYNSPMTTISSPSPNQNDCFNKASNDEAPPLDVSLTHHTLHYSSIRSEERCDRNEITKLQWDDRHRRYQSSYELSNVQRSFEDPNQVCLQDLSSCRGDPMSLVKTLQQQQQMPDKFNDERLKRSRINLDKIQEPTSTRIPPPAHHNANHVNQNGYFEFDRWNVTSGKVFSATPVTLGPPQTSQNLSTNFTGQHQPQSALVVPHHGHSLSYLSAFHLPPSHPDTPPASVNRDPEEVDREPSENVATSPSSQIKQPDPVTPSAQRSLMSIVVPNIEEELSFLTEGEFSFTSDNDTSVRKSLAPNPNGDYHLTYLKFLEGNQYISSPINPRPVKRTAIPKRKQAPTKQVNDEPQDNGKFLKKFPSDPEDDPRYFPLPKSNERSFDTDSDEELGSSKLDQDHDKDEKKTEDVPNKAKHKAVAETVRERSSSSEEKNKDAEIYEGKAGSNLSTVDKTRSSRRKAVNRNFSNDDDEDEKDVPELKTSDSDPAWEPSDYEERDRRRSNRLKHGKRKILKDDSSPSSDDDYQPMRKRKQTAKKKYPLRIITIPAVESKIKVVAQEKIMSAEIIPQFKPIVVTSTSFPFNVGDFIVATVELTNYYPPLWRVKEHHMLQKFLHFVKNGLVQYCNVPTFTAWSPGSKYIYEQVEVKFITQIKRDITIKLISRDLHRITSGEDVFECSINETKKYQDFFEIYIQSLLSQSLDSNFLPEIVKEKDDYFLSNIRVIDEYCQELIEKLVSALLWKDEFCDAVRKFTSYVTKVSSETCICSARAEVKISLEGTPYNFLTLIAEEEETVLLSDTSFCLKCFDLFQILHKVCHFKQYTFAVCTEKVNCKKMDEPKKPSTELLNELLADNDWLNKMFIDACKLWSYIEKVVVELNRNRNDYSIIHLE